MISYEPLFKTMEKAKVDLSFIQEKLNSFGLRQTINCRKYISTETLDKLCNLLRCEVSDVICYKDGPQDIIARPKKSYIKLDWTKIREIAKEHGDSLPTLSVKLHKERTYLNTMARPSKIGEKFANGIIEGINKTYGLSIKMKDISLADCPF